MNSTCILLRTKPELKDCVIWFHLYDILEKVKLIRYKIDQRNTKRQGKGGVVDYKRDTERNFSSDGTVVCGTKDVGYVAMHLLKVTEL